MPEVGNVVQFQWLPVDNILEEEEERFRFGNGIALTQKGRFSGWVISDDRCDVSGEMWNFKWMVSEVYSEFYFHKGGGNSRRAYIIRTKEPTNGEDDICDELVESTKIVNGMLIRGAVITEDVVEDRGIDDPPSRLIKHEAVVEAGELPEIDFVKQEDAHAIVAKAEEIDPVNQEDAFEIVVKAEYVEDSEEQVGLPAEDASDEDKDSEKDEKETGAGIERNHIRIPIFVKEEYGNGEESDDQAASDDQESPKKRRRFIRHDSSKGFDLPSSSQAFPRFEYDRRK